MYVRAVSHLHEAARVYTFTYIDLSFKKTRTKHVKQKLKQIPDAHFMKQLKHTIN